MEVHMIRVLHRRLVAVLVLGLGILQAFDSGIRHAPASVLVLVGAGLVLPALAFWLSARPLVHLCAAGTFLVITVVARVISPSPLPELALAAWFPAIAAIVLATAARGPVRSARRDSR
jgi:hypothetical protein